NMLYSTSGVSKAARGTTKSCAPFVSSKNVRSWVGNVSPSARSACRIMESLAGGLTRWEHFRCHVSRWSSKASPNVSLSCSKLGPFGKESARIVNTSRRTPGIDIIHLRTYRTQSIWKRDAQLTIECAQMRENPIGVLSCTFLDGPDPNIGDPLSQKII